MLNTLSIKNILKKNTMFIALIALMILFHALISFADSGSLFAPTNISNIISQNSYVVILATGMLYSQWRQYRFIDRFNCRTYRGISCPFNYSFTLEYICRDDFMFIGRYGNRGMARLLDCIHTHPGIYCNIGRYAFMERRCLNYS